MQKDKDAKERNFVATVVLVVKNDKVLLAPKKEKIGAGRWNGPGGEVEFFDPSIEFRATLEMWQEIGIICKDEDLQKVAIGYFRSLKEDGSFFVCEVHFFLVEKNKCFGLPKATSEMGQPKWFKKNLLPAKMMVADKYFLPQIFEGKKIVVNATMKNNQSELIGQVRVEEVEEFR